MSHHATETVALRRQTMPARFRATYDAAMSGRSRKKAVHAHCYECLGWEIGHETDCTSPACPLYPYRPFVASPLTQNLSDEARAKRAARATRSFQT